MTLTGVVHYNKATHPYMVFIKFLKVILRSCGTERVYWDKSFMTRKSLKVSGPRPVLVHNSGISSSGPVIP